jgi:hypothetical protein
MIAVAFLKKFYSMKPKPLSKETIRHSSRLIDFFKRFFSGKREKENGQNSYKRDYDRFPIEFEVLVSLIDSNGEAFYDKAALHDISGNGAMFFTRISEKYYIGQSLQLKIYLAGTDDVRGCIKTEATVVRMQKDNGDDQDHGYSFMGIAVKLHKTFEFERVDKNIFGESR